MHRNAVTFRYVLHMETILERSPRRFFILSVRVWEAGGLATSFGLQGCINCLQLGASATEERRIAWVLLLFLLLSVSKTFSRTAAAAGVVRTARCVRREHRPTINHRPAAMPRLGYVAATTGRSCLRRWVKRRQGLPSFPSAATHHPQVRALHYTRSTSSRDHDDDEGKKATTTTTTTVSAPNPPAADHGRDAAGANLPTSTALARVGRGLLLALPIAGVGAAAWVGRSDYHKVRKELRLARVRLALDHMSHQREVSRTAGQSGAERPTEPTLDSSTARCYALALLADGGVLAGHLVAAYGLLRGWDPEPIVNAEIASLAGALLSTGGGVRGEYLVAARKAAEVSVDESKGDGGGTRSGGGARSGGAGASDGAGTSDGAGASGGASSGGASGGASSGASISSGAGASGDANASGGDASASGGVSSGPGAAGGAIAGDDASASGGGSTNSGGGGKL